MSSSVEGNLPTENTALRQQLGRLSPLLPAMAADLAATRREANRLRRENSRLLAQIGGTAAEAAPLVRPVRCDSCGVAVAAGSLAASTAGA